MKEIEALQAIFDKKSGDIQTRRDKWTVIEKDGNAAFNRLEILCANTDFHIIGNSFYKGIKNTTEDRSTHLWDSDCDGVCVIEMGEEKHYVFVDLKSNFDTNKINDAYLQDLYTFLKMHTMLSLCEDYFLGKEVVIDLIVACKTFKNQEQEDRVMDIIWEKIALEEESFEKNFLNDLLYGGQPKMCRLMDFKSIRELPFHEDIKQTKVRMHLILSEHYEDSSNTYELKK